MNDFSIPIRSKVDVSLQASKWQKCFVLMDIQEMEDLFKSLDNFWIVQVSGLISMGKEIIKKEDFLDVYSQYIEVLKRGGIPKAQDFRSYFSSVFTTTLNALYRVPVDKDKYLVKIHEPVIQLQAHRFDYSLADHTFRSMVLGINSIEWGLQFAYPHLYQDANLQVWTVKENTQFPNTTLFKNLQRWVRSQTIATPFDKEGKRMNVPIRLGKKCLSWINCHPQLVTKGLKVI